MTLVQARMKIYDKSLVEKGLQKGRKEGRLIAIRELAQNMLAAGLDISQVAKITGLSIDTLKSN